MKIQWLVLSSMALWPTCVLAQTSTPPSTSKAAPPLSVDPAAQALLERAIQNYKELDNLSYTTASRIYGRKGLTPERFFFTRYSAPDKLNISYQGSRSPAISLRNLSDGSNLYTVVGDRYYKNPTSSQAVGAMMGDYNTTGELVAAMLRGENPFTGVGKIYSSLPSFKRGPVVALGYRVIDGDVLQGVRSTFSVSVPMGDKRIESFSQETTAWFGGTPLLLHRVQNRIIDNKGGLIYSEKVRDQQLSPTFTSDTFKWDGTGLKLASAENENDPYWDPRLKVGTAPFAFSATDVQGRAISLDNYKGKVVLLDFWATWCGPCVEGLPEIKGAYDKYHAQGLEVVGISSDENKAALTSFTKSRKMPWPQVFDTKDGKSQVSDMYGVKAIPFLLLIGKDGKITAVNPRGNIDKAVKAALAKK